MLYNPDLRAKKIWYNPTSKQTLIRKEDGAICFSSLAEYKLYLLLEKIILPINGKLYYEKPFLYTYRGNVRKWKVDFTLTLDNKPLYIEYKSAFSLSRGKKFKLHISEIYKSMPILFNRIILCSNEDLVVKIGEEILLISVSPRCLHDIVKEKFDI